MMNKSSMKGLELLGQLFEKKEDFNNASKFYNLAWEVSERRDCIIGFRIASLYFKEGNWVRSIAIGNEVNYN